MPIDASIPLGIRPVEIKPYDASEGLIKGLTLKNLMQQSKANDFDSRLKEQAYNDDQTLRSVYTDANGDSEAVRQGLISKGLYKQVNEFDKQALEKKKSQVGIDKDLASIDKDKLEGGIKKMNVIQNVGNGPLSAYKAAIAKGVSPEMALQAVQPMWEAAVGQLGSTGMFDEGFMSRVPQKFDPNFVEAQLAQTLKYSDVLNNEIQRRGQDITVRGQDMSRDTAVRGQNMSADTARRGQDITVRGQNMTDARSNERLAFDREGGVAGVVPAAGKPVKLTEDQGKATGWLSQANNAYANMKNVMIAKDGSLRTDVVQPGMFEAGASTLGLDGTANVMRSADRQKFMQSSSSMGEALLRAATGAGVNKDEAAQKARELTPQFTDKPDVVKQKLDAIPVYLESLKVRAGPGANTLKNNQQPAAINLPPENGEIRRSKSGKEIIFKNGTWEYK